MRMACAQVDRTELEGTVTDPSGGVIAGANVKIVAAESRTNRGTHNECERLLPLSGVGSRQVQGHDNSQGFKVKVVEGLQLLVSETDNLDVQLAIEAVNEQVEVNASVLGDRTPTEAGSVILPDQIADRADNGQDWTPFRCWPFCSG
jgi:hypothetical protein